MRRPLTAQERCTLETIQLAGAQPPALTNLLEVEMLQLGQLLGTYPTARAHVVIDNADAEALVMRVTLTIPREELGA